MAYMEPPGLIDLTKDDFIDDDERYARQLQAELDGDAWTSVQQISLEKAYELAMAGSTQSTNKKSLSDDERLARELQQQFNEEYSGAGALDGTHNMPSSAEASRGPPDVDKFPHVHRQPGSNQSSMLKPDPTLSSTLPKPRSLNVDDPDNIAEARSLANSILTMKCGSCGKRMANQLDIVLKKFDDIKSSQKHPTVVSALKSNRSDIYMFTCFDINIQCTACNKKTCFGCGESLQSSTEMMGAQGDGIQAVWHCDKARMALIWLLLCGYDNQVKHNKPQTIPQTIPLKRVEGSRGRGSGIGYGSESHHTNLDLGMKPMSQDPDVLLTAQVMSVLALLLPSLQRDIPTGFDCNPPVTISLMLLRSSVLDKAAELLRNDSLEDVTKQAGLYESLFNFMTALANHYTTSSSVLHSKRLIKRPGNNLWEFSTNTSNYTSSKPPDYAQSLFDCMKNLHKQGRMMLNSARANETEFQNDEDEKTLLLCCMVCDLMEFIQLNMPEAPPPTDVKKKGLARDKPNDIDVDAWQEKLALMEVSDETILSQSHYGNEARNWTSSPKGRTRALIKEINTLKTGLPGGIFVRYGESRLDVMRIIIIGPKGTPYEGGLWEFDLLCRLEFPNTPPTMHFRTTGGGKIRCNPNLYADGKICLSLLGTWSGEKWRPGKSSLLQVLVSIQAMIFCEEPYCNEPGYETSAGSQDSKNYTHGVYPMTVRYAMLEWLDAKHATPGPGIWDDVVTKHFEVHQDDILKTVQRWQKDKGKKSSRQNHHGPKGIEESRKGLGAGNRGSKAPMNSLENFAGQLRSALKMLE